MVWLSDLNAWASRIGCAFPGFNGDITYDRLGRAFAIDAKRWKVDDWVTVIFEPGTSQALKIPAKTSRPSMTTNNQFQRIRPRN